MWVHIHPTLTAFLCMCSGFFFFWLVSKTHHDNMTPFGRIVRIVIMVLITLFMVAMVLVMVFRLRFI